MNRILQAARFAAEKHVDQRRKNASRSPYINHPIEVAEILSREGAVEDEDLLIAALLHDTIEDTAATREEIVEHFGERVAALVVECTDDKSLAKAERKRLQIVHAPSKSPGAKMIKLADKTSNLRSIIADPPADWPVERQREYFAWARQVIDGLAGANERLEAAARAALEEGDRHFGGR